MPTSSEAHNKPGGDGLYREVLTSILKRFVRLSGAKTAVSVARKIPRLLVDDEGNVIEFNTDDPLDTITILIDQFEALYGKSARAMARQAVEPLVDVLDEQLLPEIGLPSLIAGPVRVLLVDDHSIFREGLVSLLDGQPDLKVVGEAGSMSEAIVQARKVAPHLVIMDLGLPDGSGVEATRAILEEAPDTKVVILTVHEEKELLFQAIRAGAAGYLFKNVRVTELLKTLRAVMQGEAGISRSIAIHILEEFARLPAPNLNGHSGNFPRPMIQPTTREIEVLRELANSATNQEIAERLVISENTVKNHVRNVLAKFHLHNRREAAEYARQHGLVPKHTRFDLPDNLSSSVNLVSEQSD